jgi:hypothetical protein
MVGRLGPKSCQRSQMSHPHDERDIRADMRREPTPPGPTRAQPRRITRAFQRSSTAASTRTPHPGPNPHAAKAPRLTSASQPML